MSSISKPNLALPMPKVRLNDKPDQYVKLELFDMPNNSSQGTFVLYRYPEVVAMDLTDEQIERGVYVEMVHYRGGKSRSSNSVNDAGYVIPPSWIDGVNLFNGKSERGGTHYASGFGNITVNRPNHYRVKHKNQVLNVWEYLNNRMIRWPIEYRDSSNNFNQIKCIIPIHQRHKSHQIFKKQRHYSSLYQPYRFAFRYVMENADKTGFVAGPITRVISLAHKVHPFSRNEKASIDFGNSVCDINTNFDHNLMQCFFEQRQ